MKAYIRLIKTALPRMSGPTAYRVALLRHQYRAHLLGEDLGGFDFRDFRGLWEETLRDGAPLKTLPLEFQVAGFLENPEWSGRESLERRLKGVLDSTMVVDEIEELRRLYLQSLALGPEPENADIRARVLGDARWTWALNPRWNEATDPAGRIELLKLKHRYFHEIGWLRDPNDSNPVIRFQLAYLRNPRIDLEGLLRMDRALPQGSEIFHRIRESNPFLVSYVYQLYEKGGPAALSEWALEAT